MKTTSSQKTNFSRSFSVALTSTFLVVFFSFGLLRIAAAVSTEYIYADTAVPQVLGDSEEDELAEAEKKEVEARRESQKKIQEQEREAAKKRNEEQRVRVQPKETEIETADGLKVKTKVEDDGRTKLEVEQKRYKFKAETRNLQRERKEIETETEIENEDVLRIATDSGRPSLMRRNLKSNSDFPLSVDPTTNALTVTTPQGTKTVTVLPDQAVANLLRVGLISTDSANLSDPVSSINLTEKDGKAVYQVQGKKKFKFLGLLNVEAPVSVTVSAEDGQVISQERSFLTDIVDFFSP